jgi:beta-1,4-N-acetylglucosaminyltransferase
MKIALVTSHGGHLTELQELSEAWAGHDCIWITYRSRRTERLPNAYLVTNIGLNPYRMIWAALKIALVFARERPDLVISTGAEIAIPAFLIARILGIHSIFIEVWTRVVTPTGTGRIVYPLATRFYVQWPELLNHYGRKAEFGGALL